MHQRVLILPFGLLSLAVLAGCPSGSSPESQTANQSQQTQQQQQAAGAQPRAGNAAASQGTSSSASASQSSTTQQNAAASRPSDLQLEWAEFASSPTNAQVDSPSTEEMDNTLRRHSSEPDGFVILTNTGNNRFIQATRAENRFHIEFHDNAANLRTRNQASLTEAIEAFHKFATGEHDQFTTGLWTPFTFDGDS